MKDRDKRGLDVHKTNARLGIVPGAQVPDAETVLAGAV